MFAVQSSSLCARSQTTTLRTNKAQKKIQRCQAVRVVVVFVVVLSSSFCEEKNARKTRSLSLSGEIVEFVFRPLFSFRFPSSALVRSRLLTRALCPLSLSLITTGPSQRGL